MIEPKGTPITLRSLDEMFDRMDGTRPKNISDIGTARLARDLREADEASHICARQVHEPVVVRGIPTPCCERCPVPKCGQAVKHGRLNAHLREDHAASPE